MGDVRSLIIVLGLLVANVICSPAKPPRWCAQDVRAFRLCEKVSRDTGRIACVMGDGEKDCYQRIGKGLADISAFDGGSIYHAGKEHGLKVIMSERHKSLAAPGTKYFGVAVVKASSSLTFDTLKGARSCHTGVQKSSGWIIPVGVMLEENMMSCAGGDQYSAVSKFFKASCAPGASDSKYNPKFHCSRNLCSQCKGKGRAKCSRSRIEPYYGYQGAFQCLKDGAGDVAFIKESILTSLSDEEQAKYKLLCKDNTRKDPKDFSSCNLAGAPTHAVLTRSDATEDEIAAYQQLLEAADHHYGHKIYNGAIFSKSAVGLDRVPASAREYDQYLDTGYVNAIAQLAACNTGRVDSREC